MTKMTSDLSDPRSLTFSDYFEIEFEGNFLRKAVCFGDVDNDGLNELVVGNDKGQVAIFKDNATKPIYCINVKGMVSAIAVGDVVNAGKNILLVITGCGHLYLFYLDKAGCKDVLAPFHTQRIPANVKEVLIGDANGDGFREVIVSLTDRVVRTYGWFVFSEPEEDWKCGKLVGLNKWEFAEQIGSIAFITQDGKQSLLVAQPGGNFILPKIESGITEKTCMESTDDSSTAGSLSKMPLDLEAPSNSKLQNAELCSSSKLTGDSESKGPTFAFATLDGNLILVKDDKIQWRLQVDHQWFSVHSLDINNDGIEEVIACAWDGTTFIVDQDRKVVKFTFKEAVSTFSAGMFAINGKNVPSFVYTTFNNSLCLYYNVHMPSMSVVSLLETLRETQGLLELVMSLGVQADDDSLRKLIHFLLYEYKNFISE